MLKIFKNRRLVFSLSLALYIAILGAMCYNSNLAEASEYTPDLIPKMTSNTTPSGIASSSSYFSSGQGNQPAWQAFNDNPAYWSNWGTNATTGWLSYEFDVPTVINKYTLLTKGLTAYTTTPKNWTFDGWDGTNWVTLDQRSDVLTATWQTQVLQEYTFNNTIAFKKYRINITANNGSTSNQVNLVIGEMEMMQQENTLLVPPTNLTATPGDAEASLSWDSVLNATGYNLKRSEVPGGPYVTVADNVYTTTYLDKPLDNNKTYYYVVSAIVNGVESPNSNEVAVGHNVLKLVLEVNEEKQLSVSDELSNNTEMDWISSNPLIAAVDTNGKVKGLKPGNTVITCTSKDKSYVESINVLVVDLEYQLAVDLSIGDTCRLTINDLANSTNVIWSSYDPAIANVSAKGKVTAVSQGLTYVIASDNDGKEMGRIYIRVR